MDAQDIRNLQEAYLEVYECYSSEQLNEGLISRAKSIKKALKNKTQNPKGLSSRGIEVGATGVNKQGFDALRSGEPYRQSKKPQILGHGAYQAPKVGKVGGLLGGTGAAAYAGSQGSLGGSQESGGVIASLTPKGARKIKVIEPQSVVPPKTLDKGAEIVNQIVKNGCNVIGFGEMGIGNTSSATMLMSYLCNLPIEKCVGRGAGLDDLQFENKITILKQAKIFHGHLENPKEVLQTFGGFEIAQMCGAMLSAFENNMLILVDGFIASSAFLVAYKINAAIIKNAIFCHLSDEFGHQNLLNYLGVEPLLKLNMRLGEGTGCAVAFPLIESAVNFLNNMASFESARVSNKE